MHVGQPHQPQALASLNKVVSSVQPDSVGMLKDTGKRWGSLISLFWGTSKQLSTNEFAARQSLNLGKAELVVVFGNQAAPEALLSAQQKVFYGWLVVLLAGLLWGFVAVPARGKPAPQKKETETTQAQTVSSFPPPLVKHEAATLQVASATEEAEAEPAFALPSSPPVPAASFLAADDAVALQEISFPKAKEATSKPPASPPPLSFLVAEEAMALSFPKAKESVSKPPASPPPLSFLEADESIALKETSLPKAQEPVSKPPPSPPLSFLDADDFMSLQETSLPKAQEPVSKPPSSPPLSFLDADDALSLQETSPPKAKEPISKQPSSPSLSFLDAEDFMSLQETSPPKAKEPISKQPSSPSLSFLDAEDFMPLKETLPKAREPMSKQPSSPSLSFLDAEDSLPLKETKASRTEALSGESRAPVSSRLSELLQPKKPKVSPSPSVDFVPPSELKEESVAVGLHGKAVHPEELLGVDYAPHENPAAVFEATLREEAERFLGADFLPEHSSLAGASAVEGPEVAEWRNVFAEFLRVRKQCQQDTESLTFERFKTKLEASKQNLLAKHRCRTVRFLVQIKEGKAAIKAIPVS